MKVIKFAPGLVPVLKHGNHDQSSHGSWATGGLHEVASEIIFRAGVGTKVDLGNYPLNRKDNPDDPHGFKTDAKKMGEVIHAQGWDKASIGLPASEFEELANNPDFVRVYRGAPEASVQAMIDGEPYIGNGAVGPGTYVSVSRDRAAAYASEQGYKVIEMLAPKKMLDGAATKTQQRKEIVEKFGEQAFYDSDAPMVISASNGNGATWSGEWTRFPTDYVIYNTSALVVKVDK